MGFNSAFKGLNITYFNLLGNVGEGLNIYSILTYRYFSYQNFNYASCCTPMNKISTLTMTVSPYDLIDFILEMT
jgi:hypothetical protein